MFNFAQYSSNTTASTGMSAGILIFYIILVVVLIASMWKIFSKAGEAGWKSIIPIYNNYIQLKIGGKPAWWLIMMFIPFIGFIFAILSVDALAKSFGKGLGMTVLLILVIGYPILAFSKAQYIGPGGQAGGSAASSGQPQTQAETPVSQPTQTAPPSDVPPMGPTPPSAPAV